MDRYQKVLIRLEGHAKVSVIDLIKSIDAYNEINHCESIPEQVLYYRIPKSARKQAEELGFTKEVNRGNQVRIAITLRGLFYLFCYKKHERILIDNHLSDLLSCPPT